MMYVVVVTLNYQMKTLELLKKQLNNNTDNEALSNLLPQNK